MKDHDLLEAVGEINEKYINNAEKNGTQNNKNTYIKWIVAAACICVVIMVVFVPKLRSVYKELHADRETGC